MSCYQCHLKVCTFAWEITFPEVVWDVPFKFAMFTLMHTVGINGWKKCQLERYVIVSVRQKTFFLTSHVSKQKE